MKLPFIIVRTADHDRLQEENAFMHRLIDSDTFLIHRQLDRIRCLQDELQQYQQALEEMTRHRNLSRAARDYWIAESDHWAKMAGRFFEQLEAAATARTIEPEPQPAELAEPAAENCSNCMHATFESDDNFFYCKYEVRYHRNHITRCIDYKPAQPEPVPAAEHCTNCKHYGWKLFDDSEHYFCIKEKDVYECPHITCNKYEPQEAEPHETM